ncbi:hypothetical protein GCM10010334_07550 [Streptomyces finlayi]|uniref:Lipoprotein n=1 Tax=Streptomyces finlayi TaxID=67296 RepID=A0A919C837_9ACTN|nr:hypothetical protein [Streptomyces finlayi]GHC80476.1 hypothetical protein GCM10010334_07550 [Streptomyces finlayi]
MNRRSIPAVAASAVAAALLLSACGGGGGKQEQPAAAPAGAAKKSPAPAAPASGPKRPDLGLGDGHWVTFDFARPADPRQSAALADSSRYIQAIWHGVHVRNANDPGYRFYSRAGGTAFGKARIEKELSSGLVPGGTDRYYNVTTAPAEDGTSVQVGFCHDLSKAFSKTLKTGKRSPARPNPANFQKYSILMRPSPALADGWVAQEVQVQERATAECSTTKPSKAQKKPAKTVRPTPPKKSDSGTSNKPSKPSKPKKTRH